MRGTRQVLGYQLATYAVCRDCADEHAWLRYGPGRVAIYDAAPVARECVCCQDKFAGPMVGLDTWIHEERVSVTP